MEGYQNFQEKLDIKILILFILRRLPDAVTRETLTDLALSEGNAGYFEYSECLAELVDSHQVEQEGNLYKISERGARNCEIVESSLPMTVRQKMETQRQAQYLFYQPDHVKWLRNGFHFPLFLRHADREIIARKQQQIRIFLPGF